MSLKERLQTSPKQINSIKEKDIEPKYFENSEISNQIDSLGMLDTILNDDDLNSIYVSGAKNIYIERNGKTHKSASTYRDNIQLENVIKKTAQNYGIKIDEQNPYFEFTHKEGVNVCAVLPPLSNVATMFIKYYQDKHATIQTLQEKQSVSKEIALILEAFSVIKSNIIIAGEKNTLKTTLLSALAKKTPINNHGIFIDYKNEVKIDLSNYTNFNFSALDENGCDKLLNYIVNSNPDKIFLNDCNENTLNKILNYAFDDIKGFGFNLTAKNPQNAINKMIKNVIKYNPSISFEEAKGLIYNSFDILIYVSRDENGKRKISSISELNINSEGQCCLDDIFTYTPTYQHESTGTIPNFYEEIKVNSLPISSNIFDINYKHTYQQIFQNDAFNNLAKKGNVDILKKFKKDLSTKPIEELSEESTEEIIENKEELNEIAEQNSEENQTNQENLATTADELMKKAQEKFEELKRNAQLQDVIQNYAPKSDEII